MPRTTRISESHSEQRCRCFFATFGAHSCEFPKFDFSTFFPRIFLISRLTSARFVSFPAPVLMCKMGQKHPPKSRFFRSRPEKCMSGARTQSALIRSRFETSWFSRCLGCFGRGSSDLVSTSDALWKTPEVPRKKSPEWDSELSRLNSNFSAKNVFFGCFPAFSRHVKHSAQSRI